jgi:hypothetical protein
MRKEKGYAGCAAREMLDWLPKISDNFLSSHLRFVLPGETRDRCVERQSPDWRFSQNPPIGRLAFQKEEKMSQR